jgi:hypothetical protein
MQRIRYNVIRGEKPTIVLVMLKMKQLCFLAYFLILVIGSAYLTFVVFLFGASAELLHRPALCQPQPRQC